MFYVQYRIFAITYYLCFNIEITIPDDFVNNVTSSLFMKCLQKQQCSAFAEIAIEIIHATGEDYSNEIIEIIEHYQRKTYVVSLLCMILGFYEDDRSKKLLWDYYHYFKEHFPNETYSDGPLLGLEEMRARKEDKSRAACSNKNITVH